MKPSKHQFKSIKQRAYYILEQVEKLYPNAVTELANWETPFQFLICIMLSAQTTDKQVNKVTSALFSNYPDSQSMSNAKLTDVEQIVKSINYFRTKAKHIVEASKMIVNVFKNEIPLEEKELVKLPGVGKKTANVFLNDLYQMNQGIAVDVHVARVAQRLELTNKKKPIDISIDLEKCYNIDDWYKINSEFVLFGRYVCKAKKPLCSECPLCEICKFCKKM
jgi:endonuclease-3